MEATSVLFARSARQLGAEARRRGLTVPTFRSPPRLDVHRSIRRRPGGGAAIAVRLRERPFHAVLADMIEGIVVANQLIGVRADQVRAALWSAVEPDAAAA